MTTTFADGVDPVVPPAVNPLNGLSIELAGQGDGCDDLLSGWEAGFCTEPTFLIQSVDWKLYGSYSYACTRHFRKLAMEFAVKIEERRLDREMSAWQDEESARARAEEAEGDASLDDHGAPDSEGFGYE